MLVINGSQVHCVEESHGLDPLRRTTIFIDWRLFHNLETTQDFKSDIVFSTCFDYDIDVYYI